MARVAGAATKTGVRRTTEFVASRGRRLRRRLREAILLAG